VITIATVAVLILVLVLTLRSRDDAEKAVEEATKQTRPRLESVIAYLTHKNVSDPSPFQNVSSAQHMAARFMVKTVDYNLTIPTIDSRTLGEGYYFVLRYVMIVFYYAMGGQNWTMDPGSGFLSSNDTCYWYESIFKIGVWCVIRESDGLVIPLGLVFSYVA
jgi:hypothetical protein